jgi:transcriptional regulator with XRE-family HTH domain
MRADENKLIMAQNIQRYMDQRGITRQQLCDALDIKYTTLRDWLKGITYPRIGKVEAMANYFGCEKSDLIEDKSEKPTENDGLTENQRLLMNFAKTVPDDKAAMILKVIQSIVEADQQLCQLVLVLKWICRIIVRLLRSFCISPFTGANLCSVFNYRTIHKIRIAEIEGRN